MPDDGLGGVDEEWLADLDEMETRSHCIASGDMRLQALWHAVSPQPLPSGPHTLRRRGLAASLLLPVTCLSPSGGSQLPPDLLHALEASSVHQDFDQSARAAVVSL